MLKPERIARLVLVPDLPLKGEGMKAQMESDLHPDFSAQLSCTVPSLDWHVEFIAGFFLSAQIGKMSVWAQLWEARSLWVLDQS